MTISSALSGYAAADSVVGTKLERYFPDEDLRRKLFERENQLVEGDLRHRDGADVPVELIQRPSISPEGRIMPSPFAIFARASRRNRTSDFSPIMTRSRGCPIAASFNKKLDQEIAAALDPDGGSPCSASTSTGSRKSTTCSATPRATRCCRRSPSASPACSDDKQMMARLSGDEFADHPARTFQSSRGRPGRRGHSGSLASAD